MCSMSRRSSPSKLDSGEEDKRKYLIRGHEQGTVGNERSRGVVMSDKEITENLRPVSVPASLAIFVVIIMGVIGITSSRPAQSDPTFMFVWVIGTGLAIWAVIRYTRRHIPKGTFTSARAVGIAGAQVLAAVVILLFAGVVPVIGMFFTSAYLVLAPSLLVLVAWFFVALIRGKGGSGEA